MRAVGARAGGFLVGRRVWRAAEDRRAGRRLQRARGGRMIPMRMRDKNCGDCLATQSFKQGADMLFAIRAGINNGDFAFADDIGACPGEGHRPRIAGRHAPHQRRQAHQFAGRPGESAVEGNVVRARGAAFAHAAASWNRFEKNSPVSRLYQGGAET